MANYFSQTSIESDKGMRAYEIAPLDHPKSTCSREIRFTGRTDARKK